MGRRGLTSPREMCSIAVIVLFSRTQWKGYHAENQPVQAGPDPRGGKRGATRANHVFSADDREAESGEPVCNRSVSCSKLSQGWSIER